MQADGIFFTMLGFHIHGPNHTDQTVIIIPIAINMRRAQRDGMTLLRGGSQFTL
jgi:hypothetical protein